MAPPQNRPTAGDFTGRQKQQNAKEQSLANEERSAEMSMATAAANQEELVGVYDGKTGERIDHDVAIEVEDEPRGAAAFTPFSAPEETVLTGKEDPEVVAPVIAARKIFTPPPDVAHSAKVRVRIDQDVEKMTYGMLNGEPNNFDFKEGLQYEVDYPIAEHLNNLGLIRQFITR